MSKIDEIRERAENCKRGNLQLIISSQDVINLCDALDYALDYLDEDFISYDKKTTLAKIDNILGGKNGKG